jgi:hypothetical protein
MRGAIWEARAAEHPEVSSSVSHVGDVAAVGLRQNTADGNKNFGILLGGIGSNASNNTTNGNQGIGPYRKLRPSRSSLAAL